MFFAPTRQSLIDGKSNKVKSDSPVIYHPLFAVVPCVVIQNSFIYTYIFKTERIKK